MNFLISDDELQLLSGHPGMHPGMEVDEEEDSHCCGKCQKTFNSLQLYLQHKLREHKYSVRYSKSASTQMLVPPPRIQDGKVKRRVGRPRKDERNAVPKVKELNEGMS